MVMLSGAMLHPIKPLDGVGLFLASIRLHFPVGRP